MEVSSSYIKCSCLTEEGNPCKNFAVHGKNYCVVHLRNRCSKEYIIKDVEVNDDEEEDEYESSSSSSCSCSESSSNDEETVFIEEEITDEEEDEEQIYIYTKNRNYVDITEPKYVKIYDERNEDGLPDIVPVVRDHAQIQAVKTIKTRILQSPILYAKYTRRR